ncbi:MAG: hypothetical protein HN712_10965 [Gemmatimonadetes bacterium]|nr:hypothetical protein [Gemmatimonadota bacterium]MBT6149947.1 hypothetical protein [Gemmatimonadota bacterium]MBT7860826.1 hypothetical protein [Gemmatimonadota bacterium]
MFQRWMVRDAVIAGLLTVMISGCSDDDNPASSQDLDGEGIELVALGSLDAAGVRVTLHGPEMLTSGYTPFEVELTDASTGVAIEYAQVKLMPMMHMQMDDGMMSHSAPTEPPETMEADEDGCFENPVVLTMPGSWELQVMFSEADGKQGSVTFDLEVEAGDRLLRLTGDDGSPYFIALVEPYEMTVGRLDMELAIFTKETMMSFPAVTDLQIGMEPTMPSMGHGSPGNEDPLHEGDGHYEGEVNFTMTGEWRIDLTLTRGDATVATTYFDVLVE